MALWVVFCSFSLPGTHTVARFLSIPDWPVLRTFDHVLGIPGLHDLREDIVWQVIDSNTVTAFGLDIILKCHLHGRSWIAENPVQRSDQSGRWKRFYNETFSDHGSWWQVPQCREVATLTNAIFVDVALCFWGLDRQKYITLMMSRDLQYVADALSRGQCLHEKGFHTSSAGLTDIDHGDSKIQYTGAYPDSFCKDVAFLLLNPGSKHLCSIDDEPTCCLRRPTRQCGLTGRFT